MLSPTVQAIIDQIRENERDRVLTREQAMTICAHEGELAVIDMDDEELLSYALLIQMDLARKMAAALHEEQQVTALRASLDGQRGNRRQRRGGS